MQSLQNGRKTRDEYLSHHVSHQYVTLAYFGFEIGERKDVRSSRTAMLEELSNMDRITQLQDEIQNASLLFRSRSDGSQS